MKKYVFAGLYIVLLRIAGAIALLAALIVLLLALPSILGSYREARSYGSSYVILDTQALAAQMESTLSAVRELHPQSGLNTPTHRNIPVDPAAKIQVRNLARVGNLLGEYADIASAAKKQVLHEFDDNISQLQTAARSRLSQISPATPPPITVESRIGRIYGPRAQAPSQGCVNNLREFLNAGVQYYSPSPTATQSARSALRNADALLDILRADLNVVTSARRTIDYQRTDMRQRQPEQELLWSFIRDLQEARDFVHEALLAGWAVDAAINEMRTTVYSRLSEYETLQLTARASLIVTLKTMGSLLALALVLCVIGDMLAAIINMARNSEEMKAALSVITLQTDNE